MSVLENLEHIQFVHVQYIKMLYYLWMHLTGMLHTSVEGTLELRQDVVSETIVLPNILNKG